MWFVNIYLFKNHNKLYLILPIILIILLIILVIYNKYKYKSKEHFISCSNNKNRTVFNRIMGNDYPKIINRNCDKKKKATLKIYSPSKRLVSFNDTEDVVTFNKNDAPKLLKHNNINKCINDSDCIIDDPCTKINCNYHLSPNSTKCIQRHPHHKGYLKCKDNYTTPILDTTKPIRIGIKTDPKLKDNKTIHLSNKVCKIMHNTSTYSPICVHSSSYVKH